MLKIKKQIKNPDGTLTEVEGTEAEVESFLKKHEKMQEESGTLQDRVKRKRDLILGKDAREEIEAMIAEAILKHYIASNHNGPSIIHHWHRWGDYWWQPYWYNGGLTYRYTAASDPNNVGVSTYSSCNSIADLSAKIGCSSNNISTALFDSVTNTAGETGGSSFLDTYKSLLGTNGANFGSAALTSDSVGAVELKATAQLKV